MSWIYAIAGALAVWMESMIPVWVTGVSVVGLLVGFVGFVHWLQFYARLSPHNNWGG